MTEQQKSLADILMHTNAAGFLLDLHGEEHTDEIGVHTMLRVLQRTSYRDACQPSLPGRPSPGAAGGPSSSARGAVRAGRRHETRRLSALRCRRRRDSPFSSRAKGGRAIEMWNGMSGRDTSITLPGVGPGPRRRGARSVEGPGLNRWAAVNG